MSVTTATLQAVADAAAAAVPSSVPLVAVAGDSRPPGDAQIVVAATVGATSAELGLVAADLVADAIGAGAAAGAALSLADALGPALEAAAAVLGPGSVEPPRVERAGDVVGADTEVFALTSGDAVVAWFTVRLRGPQVSTPGAAAGEAARTSIRVLYDVDMTLTAELGRTRLPLRQVLELAPGAVLELDRTAGSPADVMVNGRLIARGEVVVVDEDYGLRITEIIAPDADQ